MPPPQAQAAITDAGELHAVLPAAGPVALLLDGSLAATLHAEGSPPALRHRLPDHLVPSWLDLADPATGASLLPRPLDLRPLHRLALGPLARLGATYTGRFTLGWPAGPLIGCALLDGTRVLAEGLARADPPGPGERGYAFAAALLALPIGEAPLTLVPRIGGLLLPGHALVLHPAELGLVGALTAVAGGQVQGWALAPREPGRRVAIDLVIDGAVHATALADQPRPDLAGLGDGACGVAFALPDTEDSLPRQVGLAVSGTRMQLPGGPVQVTPARFAGCFDGFHGRAAHGWALDRTAPGRPVAVELVAPGGAVLARVLADQFRGDLLAAGVGTGHHAFKADLGARFVALVGQDVSARIAETGEPLPNSPLRVTANPNLLRFLHRRDAVSPATLARLRRMMAHRVRPGAGITIIMPVHDTPATWLMEALLSVAGQWCDAWELICVDDGSTAPHVPDILAQAAAQDRRIRVLRSPANLGIAAAVNFALRAARHAHVAFLDHDDALEPDAVWQLLRAIARTDADLLYSDEALTGENLDDVTEIRARPAFSHDYYLSHPYFVHLLCVRTALARELGGWDERMPISADVDFVLRVLERARGVAHIPAVLYRWRTHATSTGHAKQGAVMAATRGALQRHLDRRRTGAIVTDGVWFNQFRTDWPAAPGRILVIIPTKNHGELVQACIAAIERTARGEALRIVVIDHESDEPATRAVLHDVATRHTVMPYAGPFNYAAMNNLAVRTHGGDCEFVLFLNNDVEAIQPGWLDRLRRLAARGEVGAVGPLLLYGDRRVQHAGVILGFNDSAEHAFKFADAFLPETGPDGTPRRNLGYNCALTSVRDVSAVTAACLMTRRPVFERLGGFDEHLAIGFNDTDLCLRARTLGLSILYDGYTVLYHHESATRSQTGQVFHPEDTQRLLDRWAPAIAAGDPFYSPLLSLHLQDHVLREDRRCSTRNAPRLTRL